MFFRQLATLLYLTLFIFTASADLTATSIQPIHGTAPFYMHPIPGKIIGCSVDRPLFTSHPGDYIQVGDIINCMVMYIDKDQDRPLEPFYGEFNRKNKDNADIDTYFLFTDSSNNKTKIPRSAVVEDKLAEDLLTEPNLGIENAIFTAYTFTYTIPESAVGGKIGLNTAPISQYGLPNIGNIIATDDIYTLTDIYQDTAVTDPWPIRPNTKLKVDIWNIKDTQVIATGGYKPNIGSIPYEHANAPFLQLGETYVAVVWYDNNSNGIYEADDKILTNASQISNNPFTYQWYLVGNNSAAQGSVTGNQEILFDGATKDKITLPATNAEAISQWPNLVADGLPANEAGLQGFNLKVKVDY